MRAGCAILIFLGVLQGAAAGVNDPIDHILLELDGAYSSVQGEKAAETNEYKTFACWCLSSLTETQALIQTLSDNIEALEVDIDIFRVSFSALARHSAAQECKIKEKYDHIQELQDERAQQAAAHQESSNEIKATINIVRTAQSIINKNEDNGQVVRERGPSSDITGMSNMMESLAERFTMTLQKAADTELTRQFALMEPIRNDWTAIETALAEHQSLRQKKSLLKKKIAEEMRRLRNFQEQKSTREDLFSVTKTNCEARTAARNVRRDDLDKKMIAILAAITSIRDAGLGAVISGKVPSKSFLQVSTPDQSMVNFLQVASRADSSGQTADGLELGAAAADTEVDAVIGLMNTKKAEIETDLNRVGIDQAWCEDKAQQEAEDAAAAEALSGVDTTVSSGSAAAAEAAVATVVATQASILYFENMQAEGESFIRYQAAAVQSQLDAIQSAITELSAFEDQALAGAVRMLRELQDHIQRTRNNNTWDNSTGTATDSYDAIAAIGATMQAASTSAYEAVFDEEDLLANAAADNVAVTQPGWASGYNVEEDLCTILVNQYRREKYVEKLEGDLKGFHDAINLLEHAKLLICDNDGDCTNNQRCVVGACT